MKPEFGLTRERKNRLFYVEGKNPDSEFHFHSQIELYFIDEGEVEIWINDQPQVLKAGELSVAFSYDAHCYKRVTESSVSCLIIPTDICKEFLPAFNNKKAKNPFIKDRKIYDELKSLYQAIKETKSDLKKQGYLYLILGTLLEQIVLEDRELELKPELSTRILLYINENFRKDITLRSIAGALGYNPSYLSRYFKSCFNVGINQYLTMVRLRESVLLMQEGKNNITGCAIESGFNSIRTFYRAFYEEFQCTPKEYLNQIKTLSEE